MSVLCNVSCDDDICGVYVQSFVSCLSLVIEFYVLLGYVKLCHVMSGMSGPLKSRCFV